MKFLVPKTFASVKKPFYTEQGDRYWIGAIVVSPQYNVIYAECKQYSITKSIVLPYNTYNGTYENTQMTYFDTMFNIGDYFVDFSTGYWYGIVMIILYRDEKFNWQVWYKLRDRADNMIEMTEQELYETIQKHEFKFAFTDYEQIKKLGYREDEALAKESFYETDIDNIEWDDVEICEEENEELLNLLKSQIDNDDENDDDDDDLFELLNGC